MLSVISSLRPAMIQLTNLANPWRRRVCAVFVLLAVCSLTAFVTTRYCFSRTPLGSKTSVHRSSQYESGRQRMSKTGHDWIPPVDRTAALQAPAAYPRVAPAGPPQHQTFFEQSLYNRPPPSC